MNKNCKCCGNEKPLDQFGPSSRTKDGRLGVCRECLAKRKRKELATPEDTRKDKRESRREAIDARRADHWAMRRR